MGVTRSPLPFDRVLCAVDGTGEAVEAAIQGCQLAPGRPVTLVRFIDPLDVPALAGAGPEWMHRQRDLAASVLADSSGRLAARGVTGPVGTAVEEGDLQEAVRFVTSGSERALLTMGSGEEAELAQSPPLPPPTVDRTSRRILEAAACSVLVARRAAPDRPFPGVITVGFDGSDLSAHAYQVAAAIGEATGAAVRVLLAATDKGDSLRAARDAHPEVPLTVVEREPPEVALLKAGTGSDLLVVGRRGVHGSRDLGSVSARVAAFSPVSVLVVHRPAT